MRRFDTADGHAYRYMQCIGAVLRKGLLHMVVIFPPTNKDHQCWFFGVPSWCDLLNACARCHAIHLFLMAPSKKRTKGRLDVPQCLPHRLDDAVSDAKLTAQHTITKDIASLCHGHPTAGTHPVSIARQVYVPYSLATNKKRGHRFWLVSRSKLTRPRKKTHHAHDKVSFCEGIPYWIPHFSTILTTADGAVINEGAPLPSLNQ